MRLVRAQLPAEVSVLPGDFEDSESLRRATDGVPAVFLVSAPGPWVPDHDLAMVAAADGGVDKIVNCGQSGSRRVRLIGQTEGVDDAELVRAIEDNAAELLMAMGSAGGGEQRDDAGARWTIGGSPIDYHNAVVAAFRADAVAESLAVLKKHNVPGTWHVGPSMRDDLGERLIAAGFAAGGSEPGMAVRISELVAPGAVPGLEITRVSDDDALAMWEATLGRGFGEGEKEARWVASVYRTLGYGDPWRHYLGLLDGTPVATATVFLGAGVAGVYFVMTIPEARRRGIGAAITYAALREAGAVAEYGVLGSSPAGRSVYAGLGFREYCTIELYEWAGTGSGS